MMGLGLDRWFRCGAWMLFGAVLWLCVPAAAYESDVGWIDGDPPYANYTSNGAAFFAIRPFYSASVDPGPDGRWRKDFLWPLYTRKGFRGETYGRLLFFGYSLDFSPEDERFREWLLPIWFRGRDKSGVGYFAIFPFGGTLNEFVGRDQIAFALFPLYVRSKVNDAETVTWLWPIWSRTKGSRADRFRVWPFYGRATTKGESVKKFVLWPLWNSVEYLNERNPGGGFVCFPFYGHVETEHSDNHWLLTPFFRWARSDRQTVLHAPWPFLRIRNGEVRERTFWPLYLHRRQGPWTKRAYLWPIFWDNETRYPRVTQRRRLALPVWYSTTKTAGLKNKAHPPGELYERYWKIWPLASYERIDDRSRFRLLELWPLRRTPGIERNWAPWWTLYRRERDVSAGRTRHRLLWGLYDRTRTSEGTSWSLLKGLVARERSASGKSWRLLFVRFGAEERETPPEE